jgi:putative DNA primase/helicase
MLFVPFEKCIAEHRQNPELVEELSMELPGIFNWAYQGLLRLRQRGRFIVPEKCRRAIEQYRRDVNPARAFLLDNYVCSLEFEGLPSREVYDCYVRWCHENGYRPLNSNNFGKEVRRTMPDVTVSQPCYQGKRTRIYQGLAMQEGSEVTQYENCERQW